MWQFQTNSNLISNDLEMQSKYKTNLLYSTVEYAAVYLLATTKHELRNRE